MSFDQLKPFTSTLIAGLLGGQIAFNAAPCLADHCLAQSQALMREKEAALAEYVSSAKAQDAARTCAALRKMLTSHEQMYRLPESCSHSENAPKLRTTLLRDIEVLRDTIRSDCK